MSKPTYFVLVCSDDSLEENKQIIEIFISSLRAKNIDMDIKYFSLDETIFFIKLSASDSVLLQHAETLHVDLAFRNSDSKSHFSHIPFKFMKTEVTNLGRTKASTNLALTQFIPSGMTYAEKVLIIYNILLKAEYGNGKSECGIERLIKKNVFKTAYPVHEGPYKQSDDAPLTDRQILTKLWSNMRCWYKEQPLDLIEKYFGPEYAFYFAWFGFYNKMLIPVTLVSIICIIFGLSTFKTDLNLRSEEVCTSKQIMCPRCHVDNCKFEMLSTSCLYAHLTYLFDNPITITFAIIMSIWSTVFMEFGKRKEALLKLRWNLQSVELDMSTRFEFELKARHQRISVVNGELEPYVPAINEFGHYIITIATVILLMLLVILGIFGVMVYRLAVTVMLIKKSNDFIVRNNVRLIAASTGSIISVIFILLFETLYQKIALWLTEIENPRTQSEFDNSLIYKSYALAFVNNYTVIFYIAFLKGRFYTYPGDERLWSYFGGIRADLCDPAGCIVDLGLQLLIIMIVKSMISICQQVFMPMVYIIYYKITREKKKSTAVLTQFESDYLLNAVTKKVLITEYTQLVIQYGFVTFFAAGFPFAPLLALLNNIIEIRVDAMKLTRHYRRPIACKVPGFGAWKGILQAVTYIGVATNGFVIAFTSQFVPREIYRNTVDKHLKGFVNTSLSVFAVKDFRNRFHLQINETNCYYPGQRYPPDHSKKYHLSADYWQTLFIRLLAVIIFEHVLFLLTGIIAYAIPDIPFSVKQHLKAQATNIKELRMKELNEKYLKEHQHSAKTMYISVER